MSLSEDLSGILSSSSKLKAAMNGLARKFTLEGRDCSSPGERERGVV